MTKQHSKFMKLAIEEAINANIKNEVPIGAILVNKEYQIIARSHNKTILNCDPTAHAEIEVLRIAASKQKNYRLLGTTLYVTIEPCIMCMGAIIHSRISTVVFGASDQKWGAAGSLYNFSSDSYLNHKIKIIKGIYEYKCKLLLQNFFRNKRKK